MNKIFLLIFIVIFACNSKKPGDNQRYKENTTDSLIVVQNKDNYAEVKNKFLVNEEDIKWRIFEKNINDTLRILRNKLFAKYGYKFKSSELQNYFNSKSWYKINPNYNHSLLTKADSLSIQTVIKYENLLNDLSPDSVKLLKQIFDFRKRLLTFGFDSTIIVKKDITGDGKIDKFITKISFENQKLDVENILISGKLKLWSEKHVVEPCLEYIDKNDKILNNYPKYSYYYIFLTKYIDTEIPRVEPINGSRYVTMNITGIDTTYEFNSLLFNCEDHSEWFKKYLYNFKGNQVIFPHAYCLYESDVSYDVKVWNNLTKEFITLWSGP